MIDARIARPCLLAAALIAPLVGCGGPKTVPLTEDTMDQTALLDVGEALRAYQAQHGQPPKAAEDILNEMGMEMLAPIGVMAIREDEVIVHWGVTLPDTNEVATSEEGADTVLAYEKEVPAQGGYVLMVDRTVKQMTPEEFASAAKPAGASAPAG